MTPSVQQKITEMVNEAIEKLVAQIFNRMQNESGFIEAILKDQVKIEIKVKKAK